jgi:hypothetical protein
VSLINRCGICVSAALVLGTAHVTVSAPLQTAAVPTQTVISSRAAELRARLNAVYAAAKPTLPLWMFSISTLGPDRRGIVVTRELAAVIPAGTPFALAEEILKNSCLPAHLTFFEPRSPFR